MAEVFRALQNRLRDSTWTVVFKSLTTVHLMIREGSPDVTLAYLSKHKTMLSISSFSDGTLAGVGEMWNSTCSVHNYGIHADGAWISPNTGSEYQALHELPGREGEGIQENGM